jgi:N-acyl-phosphatidylethanolamine-hydrolysing phospholipase D
LTCLPAQHFSGRTLGRRNTTLWCGWALRTADHSLFFAGDTALHPDFASIARRCGPFDIAILPIGAYEPRWFMGAVHMNPEDCINAVDQLETGQHGARLMMIASHWGTFKLTDEPMDEPPTRMRELWRAAGRDGKGLCIMRHGETRIIQ